MSSHIWRSRGLGRLYAGAGGVVGVGEEVVVGEGDGAGVRDADGGAAVVVDGVVGGGGGGAVDERDGDASVVVDARGVDVDVGAGKVLFAMEKGGVRTDHLADSL